MATKKELASEAKKLGIELTGNETGKELEALIKTKKGANSSVQSSKGSKYVWIKDRAYINDTERVDAGLYLLEEVPSRLLKLGATVEVFTSEIPSRKLGEIAKWAGIKDNRDVSDEELLEKLVSPFKPF